MSRPEHLNCVNTADGIRRINEEQRIYDRDPEAYERRERAEREEYEQRQQEQFEAEKRFYDEQANF